MRKKRPLLQDYFSDKLLCVLKQKNLCEVISNNLTWEFGLNPITTKENKLFGLLISELYLYNFSHIFKFPLPWLGVSHESQCPVHVFPICASSSYNFMYLFVIIRLLQVFHYHPSYHPSPLHVPPSERAMTPPPPKWTTTGWRTSFPSKRYQK